ncbi:hypothetical protein HID58_083814, partial [Brassica napus]
TLISSFFLSINGNNLQINSSLYNHSTMPRFLRVKPTTRNRVSSPWFFRSQHTQVRILQGQAFHGFSIPFNNPNNSSNSFSFSTSFVFSINAPGHGLTFMISPSMDFTRAMPSEFLGLFNTSNNGNSTNRILAVEFDTVKSNEFLDVDGNYVGIDNISLKLSSEDPIRDWIEYSGEDMLLNVTLAPLDISKPKFPLLSRKMNLSNI